MHGTSHFSVAHGIVLRLRIVFLSVAAILAGALLLGQGQIRQLDRSVAWLTEDSINAVLEATTTERGVKNLLLLLQSIDGIQHPGGLDVLTHRIRNQLAMLRADKRDRQVTTPLLAQTHQMIVALDEIEARLAKILGAKSDILQHEETITRLNTKLMASNENTRTILEDLIYGASSSQAFQATPIPDDALVSPQLKEQSVTKRLLQANAIMAFFLGHEAIIATTRSLENVKEKNDLVRADALLRLKFREITVLLGQFEGSAFRIALAKEILKLRELILEDGGFVSEFDKLLNGQRVLEASIITQIQPIEKITELSKQLTETARILVSKSKEILTITTEKMIWVLSVATVFSLIAIAAALFFIVERQINRRMASLTKAVLAIADGQSNYTVDVSGPDEIGKMASALDVFKFNAAELRRSNTELEKFAYVAAHDLRSPLRAIQDLTQWTLEDSESVFSEDARQNMDMLQSRVARLNRLLSDLLEYSRVGKEKDDLGEISINSIVSEIAGFLDPADAFKIKFHGDCDFVHTFKTPLRQILLNLISNSVKHHDRHYGQISVFAKLRDNRIFVSVHDDGPGIAPKYHDRIFGFFQTLRPRDEVEGSGLGLPIIQKALQHCDGSIEIHSDPAHRRGTEFLFDIPEKFADDESRHAA
jgi:signal transduction histidine kinase